MIEINNLIKSLNITFHNLKLLETALTHRSYLNEHAEVIESNERLEFLGDAILQFLSSEYLYNKYPSSSEGFLTNLRAALVCTPSLADSARSMDIKDFIRLSRGEEESGGREKDYILANTFEAVLGSIFLDSNLETCRNHLNKYLFNKVESIVEQGSFRDYKSRLQEITQERYSITPIYKELRSWGPDHNKRFIMGLYLGERLFAEGEGTSKQRAEQEAARLAIEKINKS